MSPENVHTSPAAGQIEAGQIYESCDPRDSIRILIESYYPGHARAYVVDAYTGKRPRRILVSSLHASPFTEKGTLRRTGYARVQEQPVTDNGAPPATSAEDSNA